MPYSSSFRFPLFTSLHTQLHAPALPFSTLLRFPLHPFNTLQYIAHTILRLPFTHHALINWRCPFPTPTLAAHRTCLLMIAQAVAAAAVAAGVVDFVAVVCMYVNWHAF